MPWTTPTLKTLRQNARAYIMASLEGADALIPNSVLRVMADINAGLGHLNLQFIAWLARMLLPITAKDIWLDRWATMYLTNADGSKGRKQATYASGTAIAVVISGTGATVDAGAILTCGNGVNYQAQTQASISGPGSLTLDIIALTAGSIGNLDTGVSLGFVNVANGVLASVTIQEMTGGTDQETNDQLQYRLLLRLANPPMGGDANDYVQWALSVPGVTRAWASPMEMGIGTMTVRFMCDTLRASNNGFPLQADINAVIAYINTVRPVTVMDMYVCAPVPYPITFTISNLNPNNSTVWAAIITSVQAMLFEQAAPAFSLNGVAQEAQTIYEVWISDAAYQAAGVISFDISASDFVMPNNGSMATLGSIVNGNA
jgi:uncharacterized phage protein gp47/JayE